MSHYNAKFRLLITLALFLNKYEHITALSGSGVLKSGGEGLQPGSTPQI
jgi:hypothetical protein